MKKNNDLLLKLDGYTSYIINGKRCYRRLPDNLGKKLLTAEVYERQRENMNEFGAASIAGKNFRSLLLPYIKITGSPYVSGTLNKLFKEVINKSKGMRGKRNLELSTNQNILSDFDFKKEAPLGRIFKFKFKANQQEGGKIDIQFPDLEFKNKLVKPRNASHLKIIATVFPFNDLYFDEKRQRYLPIHNGLSKTPSFAETDFLEANSNIPKFAFKFDLPNIPNRAGLNIVACVGVVFYHRENGNFTALKDKSCMKVIGVW